MRASIWSFGIYAVASVIATLTPYWAMQGIKVYDVNDVFVASALFLSIWIGPVVVLSMAAYTRNRARVLGALSGIPLLLLVCVVGMLLEARQILALDQRQFQPPQDQHEIVAIENSVLSGYEGFEACRDMCEQILFKSRYVPAVTDRKGQAWRLYRLARGQACADAALVKQLYGDSCIVMTYQRSIPDALVVRENYEQDQSEIRQGLPYQSTVYELLERTNAQDSLLGRWITSEVPPTSDWAYMWGLREFRVGDPISPPQFYASALGIPVK